VPFGKRRTDRTERISLLLPYYLNDAFACIFEDVGFKTLWAESADGLKAVVEEYQVDLALEWQHGERDFPIRDLLRRTHEDVPVLLALNWNGKAPADFPELGYAHTLDVPFDPSELLAKCYDVIPKMKRKLIMETELWNDVLGE